MTVMPDEIPLVLTVAETARLLRVSDELVYEGIRTGMIPSLKLGRRLLVPRGRLLELLGEASEVA